MFENPLYLLCLMILCFPGVIPCVVVFVIARRFDFRNPFTPRRRNGENEI